MTDHSQKDQYLFLREGTTYIKIPVDSIQYIQADGNYAYLQTNEKRFAVKRSLAGISEELESSQFTRVSRGIVVNFNHVQKLSFAEGLVYVNDEAIKMGKAYHQDVKDRMRRL